MTSSVEALLLLRVIASLEVTDTEIEQSNRYSTRIIFEKGGKITVRNVLDARALLSASELPQGEAGVPEKLWLWKNFVDGRPEYWAFDNPYPCEVGGGDPLTLGEPCGYALVKPSTQGRHDVSEEQVISAIRRASAAAPPDDMVLVHRPRGIQSALHTIGKRLLAFYDNRFALMSPVQHTDNERQVLIQALKILLAASPAAPKEKP